MPNLLSDAVHVEVDTVFPWVRFLLQCAEKDLIVMQMASWLCVGGRLAKIAGILC